MKIAIYSLLLAVFALCAVAVAPHKAVVITYPNNTPDRIVNEAKKAIKAAGGVITHEYNIIKGFAANAPAKVLEKVQALSTEYNAIIEEDQIVTVNHNGPQ
ncbi:hypothetical protein M501DRAFT_986740 [Patellaria atrata CBS 101060]|uniref:Inhibitor I9 domain-containing protein n=1 Tax=Patellaria atrata CBS 101060 TaxID=1346257 RepID=A0A9P4VKZ4_9PEZI|nr:hypothetical protein M501DRAFT_986740 [Patellaria atrata CBS 101060]